MSFKDFILEAVETAGPNPCPPMVVIIDSEGNNLYESGREAYLMQ